MTHAIELKIARFYRVYVDDEPGSMTEEQAVEAAKKMALEDETNLSEDIEIDIEEQDILAADYEYSFG